MKLLEKGVKVGTTKSLLEGRNNLRAKTTVKKVIKECQQPQHFTDDPQKGETCIKLEAEVVEKRKCDTRN